MKITDFIGKRQLQIIHDLSTGEEGQHYRDALARVQQVIDTMPKTYETDGQGDNAVIHLHYFLGGSDWWIIERDCTEDEPQYQAFGFAMLNRDVDNAELGYIPIAKLIQRGAELDVYWTPCTLGELKTETGGLLT